MNDLELMYLLEENGYEPSIENLMILKENDNLRMGRKSNKGNNLLKKYNLDDCSVESLISDYVDYKLEINKQQFSAVDKAHLRVAAEKDEKCEKIRSAIKREIRKLEQDKKAIDLLRNRYFKELDRVYVDLGKKEAVNESHSDYDLMQILDKNGYEPSIENLMIFKENITEYNN